MRRNSKPTWKLTSVPCQRKIIYVSRFIFAVFTISAQKFFLHMCRLHCCRISGELTKSLFFELHELMLWVSIKTEMIVIQSIRSSGWHQEDTEKGLMNLVRFTNCFKKAVLFHCTGKLKTLRSKIRCAHFSNKRVGAAFHQFLKDGVRSHNCAWRSCSGDFNPRAYLSV